MKTNLLVTVIGGGRETFVSRPRLESPPDRPEPLCHVSANALEVKLATAIVGIPSIRLLESFIAPH